MNHPGVSWRRLNMLFAIVLLATSFITPATLAGEWGDTPAESPLKLSAFACDTQPLIEANATLGQVPPDCAPIPGLWIAVASDFGWNGGCTTLANGSCDLSVPAGYGMTASYNPANLTVASNPLLTTKVIAQDSGLNDATFITIKTVAPTQPPAPAPTDVPPAPTATDVPPAPTATDVPPAPTATDVPPTATDVPPTATLEPTATDEPATGDTGRPAQGPSMAPMTVDQQADATVDETPTQTPSPTPTQTPTPTPTPSPTPTPVTKTYATVSNTGGVGLRCRTQPNTSSTIITVLAEGTKVEVRGAESNGWIPVKCAGQDGWFYTQYVTKTTETTTPGQPSQPSQPTSGSGVVVNTGGGGLNCRTGPGTNYGVITVLAEGAKVETRGGNSGGWIPVKCAGKDGFVSATYFNITSTGTSGGGTTNPTPAPTAAPTQPPASGQTAYVSGTGGAGLRCRAGAGTQYGTITVLAEGTKLDVRGSASGSWLPVRCAGQDGFVFTDYVSQSGGGTSNPAPAPTPNPGTSTKTVTVSGTGGGGLNCRTGPSTGYGVITIVPEYTQLTAYGSAQNGWQQVKCAGQTGWVSVSYIVDGSIGGGTGSGALWIDINLSSQYMRVYQGNTVINQTYVSTGRYGFDTPPGTFYINWKLPSQTMTGVLGGEYYYVPNVPWVMYFTNVGHAIHGAYWHNNFGYRMSHGCVNLPVGFAQWLYGITPVGTRVYIHY